MKVKHGKKIGRDHDRVAGFITAFFIPLAFSLFPQSPASAQALQADLAGISRKLEIRYYMAEKGELPPGYVLLGNTAIREGFLQGRFDLRRRVLEYDPFTRKIYCFLVPGEYRFVKTEEREDVYFRQSEREISLDGISVDIEDFPAAADRIRSSSFRNAWVEEVKYNLKRVSQARTGGGLIDLNIPISLPKQIEWFIGDGEETRLTVSGREKITIGGTSKWCANCPVTEGRPKQQKFPDLDMQQELTVTLQGNIGEKIHVNIDHASSGGPMGSTNRVRLNYQGFEDEIIKSIEMGDTDLTLSGAQLVGNTGGMKGLFGMKVKAQLGLMDLTVIASKEEGETASGSFTQSGGTTSAVTISDYSYIKRQYFFFETPGDSYENPLPGFIGHPSVRYFPVYGGVDNDMVEVFISLEKFELDNYQGGAKFRMKACVDPENDGIDGSEMDDNVIQWYGLLSENDATGQGDYSLIEYVTSESEDQTVKRYLGIRLNQPLPENKILAVRYKSDMGSEDPAAYREIGDYNVYPADPESEVLLAELICPVKDDETDPATGGTYASTWNMMMRNVYSLGSSGLEDGTLRVSIERVATVIGTKSIQSETGVSYLRIFGLDQENTEGIRVRDNLIDDKKGLLNFYYGYIMFPWYEPFNIPEWVLKDRYLPDDQGNFPQDEAHPDSIWHYLEPELNSMIYTDYAKQNETIPKHYFDIVVESTSGSRIIQLTDMEILEGSEVVTFEGEKLLKGTDYTINYGTGIITLTTDKLSTNPEGKVSVDYQHKPLMGGGKTTLLGLGADFYLSTNSRINASFLYNAVGKPKYRPRLGDEPNRNMAADVNGSFQFYPGWMTSAANLLPRVDTDAQSSLNINGELAVSLPNPNTMGESYVDDMEAIEDSDQVTLIRRMWYEASPPIDPENPGLVLEPQRQGMGFYWYNPVRDEISPQYKLTTSKRDLNPRLDLRENSSLTTLFLNSLDPESGDWCGVMTGFPGGLDITMSQYLEIWVNDYNVDPDIRSGILHIDFGRIDEDFYDPESDSFDDEKEIDWTVEYDFGFPGEESLEKYPTSFATDGGSWDPVSRIYKGINSRVQNNYHDTEDLNKNSRFDERNEYYSLSLNLADTALIDVQRDFDKSTFSEYWNDDSKITSYDINRKKSWRMYRLDLSKAELPTGVAPRLDAIQHLRIWLESPDELRADVEDDGTIDHLIEIGELKFVGSRWEFDGIRDLGDEEIIVSTPDMKVKVGAINNKENPSIYSSPYDVEEEDGIEIREQSLLIEIENFEKDRSFRLMKRFFGQGQDFQQYRNIQFYIRGDDDLTRADGDVVDFYLQIAYDSMNFYEIAVPLTSQRANIWDFVDVSMNDLTNLKLEPGDGDVVYGTVHDASNAGRVYDVKVKGSPSLFSVRYLYSGLRNRTGVMIPRGEVWFNDLSLGNVRKDIDHAERLNVSANFANVLSLSGGWQRSGPEFRSLKQTKGSGLTTDSYSLVGKTEVNHFVPTLGFQLPVNFRYNISNSKPKYMSQSDIEIEDPAVQDSLRSVRNQFGMSVAISRSGSKNFIMKNFFDNLKAGLNYSKNASFSPTAKDTSWTLSGNANYTLQFRRDRELKLFKNIKWRYWLTNFSVKVDGSRSIKRGYSFTGGEFVERPRGYSCGWDNEISTTYDPFESMKINYRRNEDRNLAVENIYNGIDIGTLTNFSQSMELNYQPRNLFMLSQFNPRFEYRTAYDEDLRPGVREGGDPEGTRDVTRDRDMSIVFDVDIGRYAVGFGKWVKILGKEDESTASKLYDQKSSMQARKDEFEKKMKENTEHTRRPDSGKEYSLLPDADPSKKDPNSPEPLPVPGTAQEKKDEKPAGTYSDLGIKRPAGGLELKDKEEPAPADTSASDTTAAKRHDPMLLLRQIFRLMGRIDPIKSTLNLDSRNRYYRLYERSSLAYQLGFAGTSGALGAFGDDDTEPSYRTERVTLDLRSGAAITSDLSANVNFSVSKRNEESESRVNEYSDMTWPDMNVNWKGMQRWALFRKYIEQSDFTVGFIRKTSSRTGQETSSYQLSPNLNLRWKNSLTSNIRVSYSRKTIIERKQEMWDRSWSVNLDLKYEIRGSKGIGLPIPFLNKKKLKFESTLNSMLSISYTKSEKYNIPPISSLYVAPSFTYSFSRNVSGTLNIHYRRSAGGIYGYINHEVGLHATADFKF